MKKTWSDRTKFQNWVKVEIAVCEGWADQGVIPQDALAAIRGARFDARLYRQAFAETRHDVTAFLRAIAPSIGEASRFVHLGLTSNDVIDTAQALQLRQAADLLQQDLHVLEDILTERAREHKRTLMMGRTHGVHAEPTSFGLKMALWVEEVRRNRARLEQAREAVSVGKISGAVGTHATVPLEVEEYALKRLRLGVDPVSSQVVQRDRHAQFVTTLALCGASLEKFATEIRGLQRTEVREVEEPFSEGQTGSSAMPHKRNPELAERVCGLARLLRGHAVTAMENVALWHERDISHSSAERIILPDSCLALDYMLDTFTFIMRGLKVFPERMRRNIELSRGLVFSQRVLLALIEKGLSRQQAYKLVQRNAMRAWDEEKDFMALLKADAEVRTHLSASELGRLADYTYYIRYVDGIFNRIGL